MFSDDVPTSPGGFIVYSLTALGDQGQWLAWIILHITGTDQGDLRSTQEEVHKAMLKGITELRGNPPRPPWEIHFHSIRLDLPKGKAFLLPDWTNGIVRLWQCAASKEMPRPIVRIIAPAKKRGRRRPAK